MFLFFFWSVLELLMIKEKLPERLHHYLYENCFIILVSVWLACTYLSPCPRFFDSESDGFYVTSKALQLLNLFLSVWIRHTDQATKWNPCCAASARLRDSYKRSVKPSVGFSGGKTFFGSGGAAALCPFISGLLVINLFFLFSGVFLNLQIHISSVCWSWSDATVWNVSFASKILIKKTKNNI